MAVAFVQTLGTSSVKVAGTTLAVTPGATTTAGNLIIAVVLFDNAATASKPVVSSISKPGGETASWVSLGAARSTSTTAGAFSSGEMWYIKTTVAWPTTAVTVTLDTSVSMIAALYSEFSGVNAALRNTAGTAYSTTGTPASAATTGTTPVIGDLALGFLFGSNIAAVQAGSSDTSGGPWSTPVGVGSTGSTAATNNFGLLQYKVLTTASQQTFTNQAVMTSGNGVVVAILQPTPPPVITQASYRFYGNGTESGSTALAAQDTSYSADLSAGDASLLLRVRLQSTTVDAVPPTDDFQLHWEKNANGLWSPFSTSNDALADGYSETHSNNSTAFSANVFLGQSFMGDGRNLTRARFWTAKSSAPTGTLTAFLYAHTGTYGTGGTGTGSVLATSTARLASSLQTALQWEDWIFDGTFTLAAGTPYVIGLLLDTTTGGGASIGIDGVSPSHPGNTATLTTGSWTSTTFDRIFGVFTTTSAVVPFDSASLTEGAATTNRLGAGTGSFTAGKVSEDGLVDNLGWPGNNYTELLYTLTLKQALLANSDTLRFRVLRNGAATGLTYTQTPTIPVTIAAPPSPPRNIHLSNAALQPAFNR